MSVLELMIISVSLSMDAFGVAVCKGLSARTVKASHSAVAGLYFGSFQALMPLIGYFIGLQFAEIISGVDHWIAFGLLSLIGINMIKESRGDGDSSDPSFSPRSMLPLALATSIDALAVGVTFALGGVNILPAVSVIGITTFILSALGIKIGSAFGAKYKAKAELAGGIALIVMGLKILLEDLGMIPPIF